MTAKIFSPANFIKHWAQKKPNECFMRQPINGKYQHTTWLDAFNAISKLATYLQKYPKNSKIGIYSNNCRDWFIADMAIMAAGYISVPIYPTASENTIVQILSHSETKLVFVGKLAEPVNYEMFQSDIELVSIHQKRETMPFWQDLTASLQPIEDFYHPSPKDIATIVYTSGTTGVPKGVLVSYRVISSGIECIQATIDITSEDSFFSYLPLAHILERIAVELLSIVYGCKVSFVEDLSTFSSNLSNTQPTIFLAVPRIWVKLKQGIEAKFGGSERLQKLISLPLIGKLLSRMIIKKLGLSNSRYCVTGAAAISTETIDWYDGLGLKLCEGYGLSETLGISNLNLPNARKVGTVGKAVKNCEVMIADNGEILLRSPTLMDGYYKEPELSAMAIQDGWFRTGDLGEVDQEGYLSIKGRVKEIFKTSKGKYISPVPIEQQLELIFSVEQACVFGSQLSQPVAVIVLTENILEADREAFILDCEDKLAGLNESLEKHEQLDGLLVSFNEWTTSNEMMTPTLKIRRQQIEEYYQPLFLDVSHSKTRKAHFIE